MARIIPPDRAQQPCDTLFGSRVLAAQHGTLSGPVGQRRGMMGLRPLRRITMSGLAAALLQDRYLQAHEHDAAAVLARVARALATTPCERRRFLGAMQRGLIPGGRIMAAAGTLGTATLLNCFVHPVPDPTTSDPKQCPALQHCLREAAATLAAGGGIGYDFSPLRPQGSPIASGRGRAAGVVQCLTLFETLGATVGPRQRGGAQMAVLRCDHPDIEAFIAAKREPGRLRHFNLSVAITDAFMHAVIRDTPHLLRHPSADDHGAWGTRTLSARSLWAQLCKAAWATGEPGVLFLDTLRARNNLSYCETLHATNPCGEVPLPAYGACALASIDLTRLVRAPFSAAAHLDWNGLRDLVHTGVALLDRVLDVTSWPLAHHAEQAQATRRVGLGMLGLADSLIMLNLRYDQAPARHLAARIARFMCTHAYQASCQRAAQHGPFPRFDPEPYLAAPHHAARLPARLQTRIRQSGLRHGQLLALAPTGAIAIAFAQHASRGIEPVQAWQEHRWLQRAQGQTEFFISDDRAYALWHREAQRRQQALPASFVMGAAISEHDQLAMVAALAPWIDGAIAKTIRLGPAATPDTVADLLQRAWRQQIKGITVYRPTPR